MFFLKLLFFQWSSRCWQFNLWFLSAFSKSRLNIWKFRVHVLLKPGLENFEHYFASMWDVWSCTVIWTFFGIAFLWDWNENWLFQSRGHCWVFQIFLYNECSTFTASSFRIWNICTGSPSSPLALFMVILPKAHLTSHSRMSGLGEWSQHHDYLGPEDLFVQFVYSCHLFLISSASVRSIPLMSFTEPIFAWNVLKR